MKRAKDYMCLCVCVNCFLFLLIRMQCDEHALMEYFLFWNVEHRVSIAHYLNFWKMKILVTGCMSHCCKLS